jgi:hypothetical protein
LKNEAGRILTDVTNGVDYGPLACLIGRWQGDKGMDIAPEPDGLENTPFFEEIIFEACGDVTNAEQQVLAIVRYHQVVSRQSNNEVFHNESGYLTWHAEERVVTQSFVIPRGVAVVAGGTGEILADRTVISVRAALDDDDYSLTQAPFMRDNASTQSFEHRVTVTGNELWYEETTVVDIYGSIFDHKDSNTLTRK